MFVNGLLPSDAPPRHHVGMYAIYLSLALLLPTIDAQADGLLDALVAVPSPVPDDLPPCMGPAIERFWQRHQLWQTPYTIHWNSASVASEIVWLRNNWPADDLPDLREVDRLPSLEDAEKARRVLWDMRTDLDRIEGVVPDWNKEAIAIQRSEICECECFVAEVIAARSSFNLLSSRRALLAIRSMIGDRAYVTGDWPPLFPWWRFERVK